MNKTLAIASIALVAVIMGMSAVAPMIPDAYAHGDGKNQKAHNMCDKDGFLEKVGKSVYAKLCFHKIIDPPGPGK